MIFLFSFLHTGSFMVLLVRQYRACVVDIYRACVVDFLGL